MIVSIPKILIRIKRERSWLRGFAAREEPDLVISDNRYGLAVPGIFCVFITHQLNIRTPFGRWADRLLQRMNYRCINRFSRCWVPDNKGAGSLGGELSGPQRMPRVTTRYIGILSRMEGSADLAEPGPVGARMPEGDATPEPYSLVVLSGPEPQRTLLEKRILQQAAAADCRIVLVRGLPAGGDKKIDVPSTISIYDHLPSAELGRLMAGAQLVIARSGYSTVMDLARMRKRAVLIPTPGQTEQEYLGDYLAARGWATCVRQNKFSLVAALRSVGSGGPAGSLLATEPAWPADDQGERFCAEVRQVLAQCR